MVPVAPARDVRDEFLEVKSSRARPDAGEPGGSGLGLYVVRCLVELHGGSVEAQSAGTGHGSRFVVTLPVKMTTAA